MLGLPWEDELRRVMGASPGVDVKVGEPIEQERITEEPYAGNPNARYRALLPGEAERLDQASAQREAQLDYDRKTFLTPDPRKAAFDKQMADVAADNRRGQDEYLDKLDQESSSSQPPTKPDVAPAPALAGRAPAMLGATITGASRGPQKLDVRPGAPTQRARQFDSLLATIPGTAATTPPQTGEKTDGIHPALAGLRDEGFRRAQETSRGSRLLALMARAGGTAIGRGNDAGFNALDKNAEAPMQEYEAEQAHEAGTRKELAAQSDADPQSPQSALARQLVGTVMPELAKSPAFAQASYAKLASNPVLEKLIGLQVEKAKAEGQLAQKGRDYDLREAAQGLRAHGMDLTAQRLELMAERLGLAKEKWGGQKAEKEVPGVEYDNPLAHTTKEASGTRTYKEALSNLEREAAQLDAIVAAKGGTLSASDAGMLANRARMRLLPLISQIEQTGNLTKGHQEIVSSQLGPATTDIKAWLNPGGLRKTIRAVVEDARSGLGSKVQAQGGRLTSPATSAPASAETAVGKVRRTDPATGETRIWNGSAWVRE